MEAFKSKRGKLIFFTTRRLLLLVFSVFQANFIPLTWISELSKAVILVRNKAWRVKSQQQRQVAEITIAIKSFLLVKLWNKSLVR